MRLSRPSLLPLATFKLVSSRGSLALVFLAAAACDQSPSALVSPVVAPAHGDASTPQSEDGGLGVATPDAAGGVPSGGSDAAAPASGDSGGSPPPSDGGGGSDSGDAGPLGPLVVYASGYGPDIDMFPLDATTGALSKPTTTTAFSNNPSFLAINRAATHLYAVDEDDPGQVGAYTMAPSGALTFQNAVSSGGDGPPFLALDRSEAFLLVANYDSGFVGVVPVKSDGSLSAPTSSINAGMNAHMILTDPSNHFAFVPCLGSDYVAQYVFDASTGTLTPNAVPHLATAAGAGPRHIAFHPNGKLVYLINETNSTLGAYAFDAAAGTLTEIQTVSTLPPGFSGTNTAAEVWVHPSGAWVLGSNRGDDSIVVFAIDPTTGKMSAPTFTKSGGTMPRDFTLDPSGSFVFAANQGTGNVVPFRFDATSGALTPAGTAMSLTAASFVGVVRLPAPN